MDVLQFIPEQLFILIVATNILGVFLKKWETLDDRYITTVLMIFSIVFSMVLIKPSPSAFLQGILCWGVAVGVNQTFKQLTKGE